MTPVVSVIVPCYNLGRYLFAALESVQLQTFDNWECIVINDGSTDNTEEIALHFCRVDQRFIYVKQANEGLSHARNAGIRKAKGRYLQFLDADDWIASNKFETQVNSLEKYPGDFVAICDHEIVDDGTNTPTTVAYMSPFLNEKNFRQEVITEWQFRKSVPCHNFLIPAHILTNHSLRFDENLPNHEDWVLWCQILYLARGICYQHEKLAFYRMRSDSMSQDRPKMAEGFLMACYVLENFYSTVKDAAMVRSVRKIRKEIRNNLFPHGPYLKIVGLLGQTYRRLFPKSEN